MPNEVKVVLKDEVKYLWHCDYWDGPRSGVCVFGGKRCWFFLEKEIFTDEGYGPWHYLVVELSEEELSYEEYLHAEFRKYVGSHTDYNEDGRTYSGNTLKPQSEWSKFYDRFKKLPKRDYSQNRPLCRYIW